MLHPEYARAMKEEDIPCKSHSFCKSPSEVFPLSVLFHQAKRTYPRRPSASAGFSPV